MIDLSRWSLAGSLAGLLEVAAEGHLTNRVCGLPSLAAIVLPLPLLLQIVCSVLVVLRLDLQWSLAAVDPASPSRVRPTLDHVTSMLSYMISLCGLGCTA